MVRIAVIVHYEHCPDHANDLQDCNHLIFHIHCRTILCLISVGSTGAQYASCNQEFGNVCNSKLFCAAFGCSGSLPSSNPIVLPIDLKSHPDFLGLFWINFTLFFMQLGFIGVVVYFDLYDNDPPDLPLPAVPAEVPQEPKKDELLAMSVTSPDTEKRTHGLRMRK